MSVRSCKFCGPADMTATFRGGPCPVPDIGARSHRRTPIIRDCGPDMAPADPPRASPASSHPRVRGLLQSGRAR